MFEDVMNADKGNKDEVVDDERLSRRALGFETLSREQEVSPH